MKRVVAILSVFAITAASVSGAGQDRPTAKGLTVHEWGVFHVSQDAEFANASLRAEWDDLPAFAYGYIKGRTVPQHWGAYEIRKRPIIFFHANAPMQINVRIDFPGGMAGVWFPATMSPTVDGFEKQPKIGNRLEWTLGVKNCPEGWRPRTPAVPEVSERHWIKQIRRVKSDEIFARFSPNITDVEREKFIYYDGIFPQKSWLSIKVDKDRVSLASPLTHPVFDVTVVDRRNEKVRVGRIEKLGAGQVIKEVAFTGIDAARFSSNAFETLLKQLADAGLHIDEARSLANTWRQRMFETPGLNVFYRLPQDQYDALMPLTVTPKPDSTVRVGLIYHGHLEPDFAERVLELVKQFDALTFAERDSAMKKLIAIGPAALVQVQRLRSRNDLSVEVRERIDVLIKKWSAIEAFDR